MRTYIQSVKLRLKYGDRGYLQYDRAREEELKFLQRIVWHYVISNPRLATQRYGQKKIINTLFEVYVKAINSSDLGLIPARFVKEFLDLKAREKRGENIEQEKMRMAVDIVASLSEPETVIQYRRLTGIAQGSFLDYWD